MKANRPLVTFVVPCYNMADMMFECVRSILRQTYSEFEVIVMDNCSADNTPQVAESFKDPRVTHVRNNTNLGHIRNFNKGIALARGKYLWLVAADDSLRSPHVLERFVDLMERYPAVGYVFCRSVELRGSKEAGIVQWADCGERDRIWDGHSFVARLLENNCIVMSSVMARKECYDKVGLYPLDLPYACDWYCWCTFAMHYEVAYLSEPMVCFRVHEGSLTSSFNEQKALICLKDEISVLWRVADQARRAKSSTLFKASRASIASRVARALNADGSSSNGTDSSEGKIRALLGRYVNDRKEGEKLWARIFMALGDQQYSADEMRSAKRSYSRALALRPWALQIWVKYLLVTIGKGGKKIRIALKSIAIGVARLRGNSRIQLKERFRLPISKKPRTSKIKYGQAR